MGDTVAAEFLGLTWAELRPEAGLGPLAVLSGRSGVLPVEAEAEEAVAVALAFEFVGVFVAERLFKAISLALTASK